MHMQGLFTPVWEPSYTDPLPYVLGFGYSSTKRRMSAHTNKGAACEQDWWLAGRRSRACSTCCRLLSIECNAVFHSLSPSFLISNKRIMFQSCLFHVSSSKYSAKNSFFTLVSADKCLSDFLLLSMTFGIYRWKSPVLTKLAGFVCGKLIYHPIGKYDFEKALKERGRSANCAWIFISKQKAVVLLILLLLLVLVIVSMCVVIQ